jgi:predicted metal-dependent HD superfamily phosphohydrolase
VARLSGDVFAWHDRLVALYSEGHRHYHNLQHLSECLGEFDRIKDAAHDPSALEFAIWFHDAIYKPRASDNEERSADLAKESLRERGELSDAVATLILATKTHIATSHPDALLLIDIDLAILAQPRARFDEYEQQIRQEYAWVPKIIFKPKRAAILRGFLDRPRLYQTEFFFERYEQPARANIERSLAAS